jgi:integrase
MSYARVHPKTGIIWYRRAVPPALRGKLPPIPGFPDRSSRTELTKTTGTKKKQVANRLLAQIDALVQQAFERTQQQVKQPRTDAPATPAQISPAVVSGALDRWLSRELESLKIRVFNGEEKPSPFESIRASLDGVYRIQQYANSSRTQPELWREVAGFDELLLRALDSQGFALTAGHPALPRIRPAFALAWSRFLEKAQLLRHSPSELWAEPDDAEHLPLGKKEPQKTHTPFDQYLDEWVKSQTSMRSRQIDSYKKIISEFATTDGGVAIESLSKRVVQKYAEGLIVDGGSELTTKTVRSRLAALRNYWSYLQAHEHAGDLEPFEGLKLPIREGVPRDRFSPKEVIDLWHAAKNRKMDDLADLIRLGAFMGGRIESLSNIKASDVQIDEESGHRYIHIKRDKTYSGTRDVPVHSAIDALISRRLKTAHLNEGYLFPSTAKNKYEERSSAYSKAFGRLKTSLHFGPQHVFHSLRKTMARMFDDAGVSESIAADILGHKKLSMTYGVYAGVTSIPIKKTAVEKALKYSDAAFMGG